MRVHFKLKKITPTYHAVPTSIGEVEESLSSPRLVSSRFRNRAGVEFLNIQNYELCSYPRLVSSRFRNRAGVEFLNIQNYELCSYPRLVSSRFRNRAGVEFLNIQNYEHSSLLLLRVSEQCHQGHVFVFVHTVLIHTHKYAQACCTCTNHAGKQAYRNIENLGVSNRDHVRNFSQDPLVCSLKWTKSRPPPKKRFIICNLSELAEIFV